MRLIDRGMAAEDISARMASQPARSEWLKLADGVIPTGVRRPNIRGDVGSFWAWWTATPL